MPRLHNHLIIGPGAIGSLTCASVQSTGRVFVHPHRYGISLPTKLIVHDEETELKWQVASHSSPAPDVIWVCCKANHVLQTVPGLVSQYPLATVVLLHNGMGPQQQLRQQFGNRIVWGSTTCGALRQPDNAFKQTSFGQTFLDRAAPTSFRHYIEAAIADQPHMPLNICLSEDIEEFLWRKLAINAVINPITAYYQIKNGQLLEAPYFEQMRALCHEVNSVLTALGKPMADSLQRIVQNIASISAENRSSMTEDLSAKRATENNFILGYLLREAESVNLPTPLIQRWYTQILLAEQRNASV